MLLALQQAVALPIGELEFKQTQLKDIIRVLSEDTKKKYYCYARSRGS